MSVKIASILGIAIVLAGVCVGAGIAARPIVAEAARRTATADLELTMLRGEVHDLRAALAECAAKRTLEAPAP